MPRFALLDMPLRIPPAATTLSGFHRWMESSAFPKRGRISFLGGEIEVDSSLEDVLSHNAPRTALTVGLGAVVDADDLGHLHSGGVRLLNEPGNLSNLPDLVFCTWDTLLSGRVEYRAAGSGKRRMTHLVGSPDIVLEVLSHSSVRKDTQVLPAKYFDAGITEYWLVDCRSDDLAEFQILRRGEQAFEPTLVDAEGFQQSRALPYRFRLTRTRDRIGLWKCRLENRPNAG